MENFNRHPGRNARTSRLFIATYAVVGLLVLIALLSIAASGWEILGPNSAKAGTAMASIAAAQETSAAPPPTTGVPEASLVFRGNVPAPDVMAPTF